MSPVDANGTGAAPEGADEQLLDPRDREAAAREAATAVRTSAAEQAAALVGAEAAERVDLGVEDLLARKLVQRAAAAAPRPVAELKMPPLRHAADELAAGQAPEPDQADQGLYPDEHGQEHEGDLGDPDDFEDFEDFEEPDEDPFEDQGGEPEEEDEAEAEGGSGEDAADDDADDDAQDRAEQLEPAGPEDWLLDDETVDETVDEAVDDAGAAADARADVAGAADPDGEAGEAEADDDGGAARRSARRAVRPLSAASLRAAAEGKPAQVPVERALVAELRQILARTSDYSAAEAERVSQTDLVNGFLQAFCGVRLDGQKGATIEVAEAFASLDATRTMVQQLLEEARAERQDTMRLLKAVAARSRDIERDARTSALSSTFLVAESTAELNMQEVTPYNVDVLTPLSSAARDRIESLVDQELARRDLSRGRSL